MSGVPLDVESFFTLLEYLYAVMVLLLKNNLIAFWLENFVSETDSLVCVKTLFVAYYLFYLLKSSTYVFFSIHAQIGRFKILCMSTRFNLLIILFKSSSLKPFLFDLLIIETEVLKISHYDCEFFNFSL